jgi:phage gp16-like protein
MPNLPQQKELLVTYFNTMKDVTMITNKISEEELKPKKPNP